VLRHHHVALDTGIGIGRVSRFLRGKAVGLVLGGGGMRAASCYGVIKSLEEQGIRADVVGGTSAGAIAAAQYAMGWDAETIASTTQEKLMKKNVLFDPTLPLVSVMRAYRVAGAYKEVFGDVYLEDLWTTAFTISGNLTRAEMVVHQTGLLRHAVRASTSLAGIHPPALNEAGEMLIDGGIFNNTPADVARAMVDTGPVIAVDLGFTKRRGIYQYGEYLNGFRVMLNRLNPFTESEPTPSIVSIMMRANALGSINATAEQVSHADLLLQPPVSDYGLFDFDAFDTVVTAGYEYAHDRIAAWVADGGMEGV
jgi:predicted acylesterase/phospholipase RssA